MFRIKQYLHVQNHAVSSCSGSSSIFMFRIKQYLHVQDQAVSCSGSSSIFMFRIKQYLHVQDQAVSSCSESSSIFMFRIKQYLHVQDQAVSSCSGSSRKSEDEENTITWQVGETIYQSKRRDTPTDMNLRNRYLYYNVLSLSKLQLHFKHSVTSNVTLIPCHRLIIYFLTQKTARQ